MAYPNPINSNLALITEQMCATMAALVQELKKQVRHTPTEHADNQLKNQAHSNSDQKPDRKVLVCGYNEEEDCLCLEASSKWSVCNDIDDDDGVTLDCEEEANHVTQLQMEKPDDDSILPKEEDHEGLLAKLEDPSPPIHPICIQLIHDKVTSLPHTDYSFPSLSTETALEMFYANKMEIIFANKVFDKSPERNGYIVELKPKPPDTTIKRKSVIRITIGSPGPPKFVNVGVTKAKEVELEDPVENIGAKLVVNLRLGMSEHMKLMHQSDYMVLDDLENQLSLTKMGIMDACKLCLALDVSKDVQSTGEWPISKVAVLVIDSPTCRDLVLNSGALMPLLAQINKHSKLSMLRNFIWILSNFGLGKPPTPFEQMKPALSVLWQIIHLNDKVRTDVCWALLYPSDGPSDKILAVIEAGFCPQLVKLLLNPSHTVLIPALQMVGNIVTGDDGQTHFVIDNQVLPCLYQLLTQNHKKSIKKEACWTISNITAGNKAQIQAVVEANIILPLVHLLQHAEFDIKKEAAWAISNATSGGSHDQIRFLASQGCIKPLCDLLICPDPRIVTVCLEGLENILKVGEADKEMGMNGGINIYAQLVDECEGLDKIENLQTHDNNEIYEKAVKILERYWAEEDEEQNVPDGAAGDQQGFSFGNNSQPNLPSGGFKFG